MSSDKPRILFVAPQTSVAALRWMAYLGAADWDAHLFPMDLGPPNPYMKNMTVHRLFAPLRPRVMLRYAATDLRQFRHFPNFEKYLFPNVQTEISFPIPIFFLSGRAVVPRALTKTGSRSDIRPAALARTIRQVAPDIVHSLGIEAGLVTLSARRRFGPDFPRWVISGWRNEFPPGKPPTEQNEELCRLLPWADYYGCEDAAAGATARAAGFRGELLPFMTRFEHVAETQKLGHPLPPSQRRTVIMDASALSPATAVAAIQTSAAAPKNWKII